MIDTLKMALPKANAKLRRKLVRHEQLHAYWGRRYQHIPTTEIYRQLQRTEAAWNSAADYVINSLVRP